MPANPTTACTVLVVREQVKTTHIHYLAKSRRMLLFPTKQVSYLQLPPYERVGGAAHGRGLGQLPPAQPRPHQPGRHQGRGAAHQVHAAAAWSM